MIDRAFQDRAEELGLREFCMAVADGLSGKDGYLSDRARLCSCDLPNYHLDPLRNALLRLPHDQECARTRFAVMFGSEATIEHIRNQAHEVAILALALDAHPRGALFDDVEAARALLGK